MQSASLLPSWALWIDTTGGNAHEVRVAADRRRCLLDRRQVLEAVELAGGAAPAWAQPAPARPPLRSGYRETEINGPPPPPLHAGMHACRQARRPLNLRRSSGSTKIPFARPAAATWHNEATRVRDRETMKSRKAGSVSEPALPASTTVVHPLPRQYSSAGTPRVVHPVKQCTCASISPWRQQFCRQIASEQQQYGAFTARMPLPPSCPLPTPTAHRRHHEPRRIVYESGGGGVQVLSDGADCAPSHGHIKTSVDTVGGVDDAAVGNQ
jgi:hypothetical protein